MLFSTALLSTVLFSQDRPSRSKALDYPVHSAASGFDIGAEYLVHSIPAGQGYLFAKDYLVVEVGLFPANASGIRFTNYQFSLLINGKRAVSPDSPGMVAAALKYPNWEPQRNIIAQAGPVIVGAPPSAGRFPDDRRQGTPLPRPAGDPPDPAGIDKEPPKSVDETVAAVALPEGLVEKPVDGCLFFSFRGKLKSIRSLALLFDPGGGQPKITIRLL